MLRHAGATDETTMLRAHLDTCKNCWGRWNRYRWDQAVDTAVYRDLETFLGPRFVRYLDSSLILAHEWEKAAPGTQEQIAQFFRTSDAYLYNLIIWEASGNRPPYIRAAAPNLIQMSSELVMDYGSGTGSDTLALRSLGFQVTPCDYASPATRFFQWRARRLGQPTDVHEPHELYLAPKPDTLWIIDTIDHLPDIDTSLGQILDDVSIVICEDITPDRAHGKQGFHHRRSLQEIADIFRRYDLYPAPHHDPQHPLIYWKRRHLRASIT
ncbi:MAG: hypothetical protein ACRDUV_01050 [Pseudonocardiaceae bacterium]